MMSFSRFAIAAAVIGATTTASVHHARSGASTTAATTSAAGFLERSVSSVRRFLQLEPIEEDDELIPDNAEPGRNLARFTKGTDANTACWDRFGVDGWHSVIDVHNHFHPFEGPNVPYENYVDWLVEHGILFTVIIGLGQRIIKSNAEDPQCCYYLHCPTFNYTVTPSDTSDRLNADWFTTEYKNTEKTYMDDIKMILSVTFPDLQVPGNNIAGLDTLEADYPNAFGWMGEINLVKHALAANGFFNNPTVTEADLASGMPLHDLFTRASQSSWPTTIHADMGCDNFNDVPGWGDKCIVEDPTTAAADFEWYKEFLGIHYGGFFDTTTNQPLENFSKIQYVKIFDAVLTNFPDLKVTWAHLGLSKELLRLHPSVHIHILKTLFDRHVNLYADISWDIIAQLYLMNYAGMDISELQADAHEDLTSESEVTFNSTYVTELRASLQEQYNAQDDPVDAFGSAAKIDGPTYSMATYYDLLHEYDDRFLTGTDFVASLGTPEEWPGLSEFKDPPTGCMKDKASHARQLTDTSSINMLLDDEAFRKIVLGENFFRITGMQDTFQAPPVCPRKTNNTTTTNNEPKSAAGFRSLFMTVAMIGAAVGALLI